MHDKADFSRFEIVGLDFGFNAPLSANVADRQVDGHKNVSLCSFKSRRQPAKREESKQAAPDGRAGADVGDLNFDCLLSGLGAVET